MKRTVVFSFILPMVIMAVAFGVMEVYPFGDNQIAVIDMYHQYVPFLSELQFKLQNGGSLFYTWNGAGGSNFWNLIAYYGASPLNLLLAVFPSRFVMEAITLILLIKIGLSGGTMAMYLRYVDRGEPHIIVGFATLYALSSFVMAYYWCIMWMDAVALLPLCILGLHHLMDKGKILLYTITLAVIVFVNYYMAIMVCIFIMFYYPALYFLKIKKWDLRSCCRLTVKAVGCSFLAIAMSAAMLLPTYISMQSTYYISTAAPKKVYPYSDVMNVLNQMLPNGQLTFRSGLPNIYCGLIIVILLAIYIINEKISLRSKIINGIMLLFMLISLNVNVLDFMWHGFHYPNQLPFRYTFLISFLMIGIAYDALRRFDGVSKRSIWKILGAGLVYYVFAQKAMKDAVDNINVFFYSGVVLLLLYCGIMLLEKSGKLREGFFVILMLAVIAVEASFSTYFSIDKIGTTLRSKYNENKEDVCILAAESREAPGRTEMDANYLLNCPAFYHYKGVSQFSSSINADTTAFMEKIGVEGEPSRNRFSYNQTNPVTNAILDVRYIISKNGKMEDDNFVPIDSAGYSTLYENRYPMSVGYVTGNEIRTWKTHSKNPFEVLDDYVRAATSNEVEGVFRYVDRSAVEAQNMKYTEKGYGKLSVELKDEESSGKVSLVYPAEKGVQYYVFVEGSDISSITVKTGEKKKDVSIMTDCGGIVRLDSIDKQDHFDIEVGYKHGKRRTVTAYVASMDNEAWNRAYGIISSQLMKVSEWSDTRIEGTVDVKEDGVLVTSVMYDKGWRLFVDGKERQIKELLGDAMIATGITAGKHTVVLEFTPPGIAAGLAISVAACVLLAVLELMRRRRLRRGYDSRRQKHHPWRSQITFFHK